MSDHGIEVVANMLILFGVAALSYLSGHHHGRTAAAMQVLRLWDFKEGTASLFCRIMAKIDIAEWGRREGQRP